MTQTIRRIDPVQAGKVLTVLYLIFGLILAPFFLIAALFGREGMVGGIALAIIFPLLYAVIGFFSGLIVSAAYNVVAGWVGGITVDLD